MTTDIQLTGGPVPLKISGREFSATPLTDVDYAALDGFVQDEIVDIARRRYSDLLPSERQELLSAAIKAAAGVSWSSPEGLRVMSTRRGGFRMGWQMIIKSHPNISFDDFFNLAAGQGETQTILNIREIDRVYVMLNTRQDENNGDEKKGAES